MKKLRRALSLVLLAAAFGSVSACSDITGFDCDPNGTGSNTCE